jgi:hemerythrin
VPLIEWSERFVTGHPYIDRQHRALIRQINELHDAVKEGRGTVQIGSVLGFLKSYTIQHFRDEELLMQRIGFPGYEDHKAAHESLLRRAAAWSAGSDPESDRLTSDVARTLSEWLGRHILEEDMAWARYAASRAA